MDEGVKAEQNDAAEIHVPGQFAEIQRAMTGDETDIIKQHHQKADRQQQCADSGAAGQHDEQRIGHGGGKQIPLFFAKAHGPKDLVHAQQANACQDQIKQHRVKEGKHHSQHCKTDNGSNYAGFHKRRFLSKTGCPAGEITQSAAP